MFPSLPLSINVLSLSLSLFVIFMYTSPFPHGRGGSKTQMLKRLFMFFSQR